MSIYDRDFSKIVPSAFLDGSVVQAVNVLEAALKEIRLLNAEIAFLQTALERTAKIENTH